MSNIDEILKQADDYADAERALASLLADECDQLRRNMLRLLLEGAIAAALADARREGAEAMRAKAAQGWDGCMYNAPGETLDIGTDIRALPLPESTVEVVMDREHGGLTSATCRLAQM